MPRSRCHSHRKHQRAELVIRRFSARAGTVGPCRFLETDDGQRVILHFGAVDYDSTVWVDGQCIGNHEGGYTPFCFDVSRWAGRSVPIVVRAEDDPDDLAKPRGKQDWQPVPHSIWYPRTTGIWQTVWIEVVPPHVARERPLDANHRALGDRPGIVAGRCTPGGPSPAREVDDWRTTHR